MNAVWSLLGYEVDETYNWGDDPNGDYAPDKVKARKHKMRQKSASGAWPFGYSAHTPAETVSNTDVTPILLVVLSGVSGASMVF